MVVWESRIMRTAGPLVLNDRLRALPGPPLRFSPGWKNGWAFGPKSQPNAEYLCINDRALIQRGRMDSRMRTNDGTQKSRCDKALVLVLKATSRFHPVQNVTNLNQSQLSAIAAMW